MLVSRKKTTEILKLLAKIQVSRMIMIVEISDIKGTEFAGYEFYFKKNICRTF